MGRVVFVGLLFVVAMIGVVVWNFVRAEELL